MCVCVCVYARAFHTHTRTYIYIYIERERERNIARFCIVTAYHYVIKAKDSTDICDLSAKAIFLHITS